MVRREVDSTTFMVKDLCDQPTGQFLVYFNAGRPTIVWADELEFREKAVVVFLGGKCNAIFNSSLAWFAIDQNWIETMTIAESNDIERSNVYDRAVTGRDLKAIFDRAVGSGEQL